MAEASTVAAATPMPWPPLTCPCGHPAAAWVRTGDAAGFCGECNPLALHYLLEWQRLQNVTLRLEHEKTCPRQAVLIAVLETLADVVEARFVGLEIVALVPRELRQAVDAARAALAQTKGEKTDDRP